MKKSLKRKRVNTPRTTKVSETKDKVKIKFQKTSSEKETKKNDTLEKKILW
jgi:hypothetical protein